MQFVSQIPDPEQRKLSDASVNFHNTSDLTTKRIDLTDVSVIKPIGRYQQSDPPDAPDQLLTSLDERHWRQVKPSEFSPA